MLSWSNAVECCVTWLESEWPIARLKHCHMGGTLASSTQISSDTSNTGGSEGRWLGGDTMLQGGLSGSTVTFPWMGRWHCFFIWPEKYVFSKENWSKGFTPGYKILITGKAWLNISKSFFVLILVSKKNICLFLHGQNQHYRTWHWSISLCWCAVDNTGLNLN